MQSGSPSSTSIDEPQRTPVAAVSPLLLTVHETARVLAVGRTTIYELIWRGELTPIRIGRSVRFSVEQLEEFVRSAARS